MKKLMLIAVVSICCASIGCMNLYIRCPGTEPKIAKTYQCTEESFAWAYVIMFPQVLPMNESKGLVPANIVTIPLGAICFIDVACEGIVDTVLWPIDYFIAEDRTACKCPQKKGN